MAGSFEEAIAKVEGQKFDEIVGYLVPPRKHAPTDEAIKAAFDGFDYRHVSEIVLMLSRRYRCHPAYAEDAVHDRLEYLLVTRPDLYREDPMHWMGLLYALSRYRLIDIKAESQQSASIEALHEAAGDAPFEDARPVVAPSGDQNEACRHLPQPQDGVPWNRMQAIGAVQRFRDHYGRPPRRSECSALNLLPSPGVIRQLFRSFEELIIEAGMVPPQLGLRRKPWTPIEAAKACASFRRRNGFWPGWMDVKRSAGTLPGASVMIRFFGGTQPGVVQAGAEAILGDEEEPEAGVGARV